MTSAFHDQPVVRLAPGSELPEGWTEAPLAELVVHALGGEWGAAVDEGLRRGWTPVSVLRGTDFREWEESRGRRAAERAVKPSSLDRRRLEEGDIVVEISGGGPDQPVGRTLLIDKQALDSARHPLICSNFCRQIRLHPSVEPAWIALALRCLYGRGDFNAFQSQTTNIRNLDFRAFLAGTVLPLPPLAEQRRIVERVGELMERVRRASRRVAGVSHTTRRLRQSVLAAGFSGRLTEDWRAARPGLAPALPETPEGADGWEVPAPLEAPEVPEGWGLAPLDDLLTRVQYGTSMRADGDARSGLPVLRMTNIQEGRVDLSGLKYVRRDADGADLSVFLLERGDILFNRTNSPGLVGKAAVYDSDLEAIFASYLVRLTCDERRVSSRFVCAWINSPWGRQWARTVRTDCVSQSNINTTKLRTLPVPVPPLAEQHEIVQRIERALLLADAIDARVAAAAARIDRLGQSVFEKALRGDLIAAEAELARREGRAYEPGWELLDRVRIDRARHLPAARRSEPLALFPEEEREEDEPARRGPARRPVTVYDPDQVLVAFRQSCWGAGAVAEEELLRRVAARLGIPRFGRSVRTRLRKHLEVALARRIVARRGDLLAGATPTFARYDDEFLLGVLRSVLQTGVDYDHLFAVRLVASHLGYGQVTAALRSRMEEIFRAGARKGLLTFQDGRVRRRV
jgi:type I restriction enzyme S subunit